MLKFGCKMCGGEIRVNEDEIIAECEYCGKKQAVPSDNCELINVDIEYRKAITVIQRKNNRKKVFRICLISVGVIVLIGILFATHIFCFHNYSDATVLEPQRCYYQALQKRYTALTRQREDKQFKADELSGFLFELGELNLLDTEWKDSRFRAIVERITVHNDGRLVFTFTNGSEETVMM